MTGYKGKFEIKWWAWYLVDLRDWHKPVIVRKHFQTKGLAKNYADRWFNNEFEPIRGYEAVDMDLKQGLNYKKKNRHRTQKASKYVFPSWCKTQKDREKFRTTQRRRIKRSNKMPEITLKELYYLLDRNPMRFCIRTKIWKNWYYAYALPTANIDYYIKALKWPRYVTNCVKIEKTLLHYGYDIGMYPMHEVVLEIYKEYGHLIEKFQTGWVRSIYWTHKEYEARGFKTDTMFPDGMLGIVKSNPSLRGKTWYWPERGRLGSEPSELLNIYELQDKVGIPGYTQVYLSKAYRG